MTRISVLACALVVATVGCGGDGGVGVDGGRDVDASPLTDADPNAPDAETCVAESDQVFCERAAICGSVTANDNCGDSRTAVCDTCPTCNQSLAARLIAACLAMPGLSVSGQLSCIAGGAGNANPEALIGACTTTRTESGVRHLLMPAMA